MKAAFLVVDVQQAFFDNKNYAPQLETAAVYINHVSAMFRKYEQVVVHVQHGPAGGGKGNPGFEVGEKINQEEGDLYVTKEYGNSFWRTDLEQMLKDRDVDLVIVSGFAAQNCVLATYNGSIERDFETAILHHGIAGFNKEDSRIMHHERNIVSHNIIKYILKEKQGK